MEKQWKLDVLEGASSGHEDSVPADNTTNQAAVGPVRRAPLRDVPVKIEWQLDEGFVKLH